MAVPWARPTDDATATGVSRQIAAGGGRTEGQDPSRIADLCLTLLVPSAWRYLVVERGWTAAAFARSRHVLVDALLASALPPKARRTRRPASG